MNPAPNVVDSVIVSSQVTRSKQITNLSQLSVGVRFRAHNGGENRKVKTVVRIVPADSLFGPRIEFTDKGSSAIRSISAGDFGVVEYIRGGWNSHNYLTFV